MKTFDSCINEEKEFFHLFLPLFLYFFSVNFLEAQPEAFISSWVTFGATTSCNTCITIPTKGSGYNYEVDWDNDGTYDESGITGDVSHDFGGVNTYTIRIRGDFPRIFFPKLDISERKIVGISQWGTGIQWETMDSAFLRCQLLRITALDAPDLTAATSMRAMLSGAAGVVDAMNHWDVSTITDMAYLFAGAIGFNQPLNSWDVSAVEDMSNMFSNATIFNQPIGNWIVSNVKNMSNMFFSASDFNQSLNTWDVSSVENMSGMFSIASDFNQPLDNWTVTSVKDMNAMFFFSSFNQPIGNWIVTSVEDMSSMFQITNMFNQPLNNWDVSSVKDMSAMFNAALTFNQPLDNWIVSSVTDMSSMFAAADAFNQPVENWDVSSVTTMSNMFLSNMSFNNPLGNWDIGSVADMTQMFYHSALDIHNYDETLIGWSEQNVKTNVTLGAEQLEYCAYDARDKLISMYGWNIIGDIQGTSALANFLPTSAAWYVDPNNWSTMTFPTYCTDITISANKEVVISPGKIGMCKTLSVDLGAAILVPLGGELDVRP